MMELSMEERSFIQRYRQASPRDQKMVQRRLRAAAAKAEREHTREKREK